MAIDFDNTTFTSGQATTGLYALGTFTGTSLLSGVTPVTINGTIDQPNSTVQVDLDLSGVTYTGATGTYLGYSPISGSNDYVYYFSVTGAGITTPVTIGVTGASSLPDLSVATTVDTDNVSAPTGPNTPVCFVAGTFIRTPSGDVEIEKLSIGDLVLTASGEARPVKWLGHRMINCLTHPQPYSVRPIRIAADAFGPGKPERDLLVSPGHSICTNCVEEVLVPASALLNGATVVQLNVDSVDYWHLELENHDLVVANGLTAESYLEMANRDFFFEKPVLSTDASNEAPTHDDFCRPYVDHGIILDAIRTRVEMRALAAGWNSSKDFDFHLLIDGRRISPQRMGSTGIFLMPAAARNVRLLSDIFVPFELGLSDMRQLGMCVRQISILGSNGEVRGILPDDTRLREGFYPLEEIGGRRWRWTNGSAVLDPDLWSGLSGTIMMQIVFEVDSVRHWVKSAEGLPQAVTKPQMHLVA